MPSPPDGEKATRSTGRDEERGGKKKKRSQEAQDKTSYHHNDMVAESLLYGYQGREEGKKGKGKQSPCTFFVLPDFEVSITPRPRCSSLRRKGEGKTYPANRIGLSLHRAK